MSRRRRRSRQNTKVSPSADSTEKTSVEPPPQPVDIHDGIPDRVSNPSRRRLVIVVTIFVAWVVVLMYFLLAARVD